MQSEALRGGQRESGNACEFRFETQERASPVRNSCSEAAKEVHQRAAEVQRQGAAITNGRARIAAESTADECRASLWKRCNTNAVFRGEESLQAAEGIARGSQRLESAKQEY